MNSRNCTARVTALLHLALQSSTIGNNPISVEGKHTVSYKIVEHAPFYLWIKI